MQAVLIVLAWATTAAGAVLLGWAAWRIVRVVRLGQPAPGRTDQGGRRLATMLRETLGHTKMLTWSKVGVAHWFVMIGFVLLFGSLVTAYGQVVNPEYALPLIGHFAPFTWMVEILAWVMLVAIGYLIVLRLRTHPERLGRESRFFGSTFWQAYYVEFTIVGVGACIVVLRGAEYALIGASRWDFPLTWWIGESVFGGASASSLETVIVVVAALKIFISMAWAITLGLNVTMGVAWHRFLAWPNIFLGREPGPERALGAAKPLTIGGQAVNFEELDDIDEDASFGVGSAEEFSWKGLMDLSTCTECGRCQSQCPAWTTDKPLSPKLLITELRDHAYAKAPYLLAGSPGEDDPAREDVGAQALAEAERPLVGPTEGEPWSPDGGGVIDPDVLWSCTQCGACVEQCPVDIEHVDHILDLRRYQSMIAAEFPSELNGFFKNLERSGNPWGVNASQRMDWAADLSFEVKQVGVDVEDLSEVDWLFWVGCAGAFEERAKKATQATAELLHTAGVSFAVLGDGETCSGDPARRSGNEFLYQQLALQNVEVLRESKAIKVVATCAHCFNTLGNEYEQLGLSLEVVHHSQLLNRLVREGHLAPVAPPGGAVGDAEVAGKPVTYHDPCFLGRHNQVYEPPRELVGSLPGVEMREMPRHGRTSFCCGAGGARMWMEENLGSRINDNRTDEAIETGAETIATGCPFCRVMLGDGLTNAQADGRGEDMQVLDVSQLLLAGVRRGAPEKTEESDS